LSLPTSIPPAERLIAWTAFAAPTGSATKAAHRAPPTASVPAALILGERSWCQRFEAEAGSVARGFIDSSWPGPAGRSVGFDPTLAPIPAPPPLTKVWGPPEVSEAGPTLGPRYELDVVEQDPRALGLRLQAAVELWEFGVELVELRLHRERPEAPPEEIRNLVREWLGSRPADGPALVARTVGARR
jgi:hypothetical protein